MADEITANLPIGARRNEDIALEMMKFIAMTTGYGKTGSPGAGFQGGHGIEAGGLRYAPAGFVRPLLVGGAKQALNCSTATANDAAEHDPSHFLRARAAMSVR